MSLIEKSCKKFLAFPKGCFYSSEYLMASFKQNIFILLVVFAVSHPVSIMAQNAPESYRGRTYFEEAYSIEKNSPARAIELYRLALSRGLDAKMNHAALWRLFHLYRETGEYGNALMLAPKLGKSRGVARVLENLKKDLADHWNINNQALEAYWNGVKSLAGYEGAGEKSYSDYFIEALSSAYGNREFRSEIMNRLVAAGKVEEALSVLDGDGITSLEDRIMKADLLLSLKRYDQADTMLREIAAGNEISKSGDKYRVLYLLAKIARSRNDLEKSVRYFRFAANYASEEEQFRQLALASYSLYRENYTQQAAALVRNIPNVSDENVMLLRAILGVEVDHSSERLEELREMAGSFSSSPQGYLENRALQILAGQRVGR